MLRRHEARRLDFMRYVEYELNLESLRALRTKRVEGGGNLQSKKKKSKKGKAATADFCCVRLVRWIFDRAVMKFPGDVDIWLHYIEFAARQGQSKVRRGAAGGCLSVTMVYASGSNISEQGPFCFYFVGCVSTSVQQIHTDVSTCFVCSSSI